MPVRRVGILLLLVSAALAIKAPPQPSFATSPGTTRVSVASDGTEANAPSTGGDISADGRFVVFNSEASNLVAGDNNNCPQQIRACVDVFVRDTVTGTTELINKSSTGIQSAGVNGGGGITPDGRFVTFSSASAVLVPGDTNGQSDGFVRDRLMGTTERVTVGSDETEANGSSYATDISNDGRFVLFSSGATNLIPGDNSPWGLFVRDRSLGTTEPAVANKDGGLPNGGSYAGVLSADGRFVAFVSSATDLTDDQLGPFGNVFVRDRLTGRIELVSVAFGGGGGNGWSGDIFTGRGPLSINADGRYVAFDSRASDLVPGDAGGSDVFVRDRLLNTTSKVSVNASGTNANGESYAPRISADGRYVAYMSSASDLVPGDPNPFIGRSDVFVRDLHASKNERVNVDSSGVAAEYGSDSTSGSISGDGGRVIFGSNASNLVPGDSNNMLDVFVRDLGDADNDGAWDPFDTCPTNADCDADSVSDGVDNCPNWPNAAQALPPWPVPADDPDCDGFSTTVENSAGTNSLVHCGANAWPADINSDGLVDIIGDIVPLVGQYGRSVPPVPTRYDLAPDPPDRLIDIFDIARMVRFFGHHC